MDSGTAKTLLVICAVSALCIVIAVWDDPSGLWPWIALASLVFTVASIILGMRQSARRDQ